MPRPPPADSIGGAVRGDEIVQPAPVMRIWIILSRRGSSWSPAPGASGDPPERDDGRILVAPMRADCGYSQVSFWGVWWTGVILLSA